MFKQRTETMAPCVRPVSHSSVPSRPSTNTNSHGCTAPETTNSTIGVGLFPLLAMLNHACAPNCAFVFLDGRVAVRTLRPVAAVGGAVWTLPACRPHLFV